MVLLIKKKIILNHVNTRRKLIKEPGNWLIMVDKGVADLCDETTFALVSDSHTLLFSNSILSMKCF